MDEDNFPKKKTKMRTASDIASRIMWDDNLNQDNFIVGYIDRFKGLMEEKFSNLEWGDPASVDHFTLALPKHRIQYFKYKNKKVWDKSSRLDIVFGSTGDNRNIQDFMKEVDHMDDSFFDEGLLSNHTFNVEEGDDFDNFQNVEWDNSDRSNFFIAARITNSDIVEGLSELRNLIVLKDETLEECCMSNAEFHMTLLTLRLVSKEDVQTAVNTLKKVITKDLVAPIIELNGVDLFRHRVLYSIVKHDNALLKLRECLIEVFSGENMDMQDKYMFVPHVTIMKLSRPSVRQRHSKYIDPYLYIDFENKNFGSQEISSLCLCEMGDSRRDDGFYQCATEVHL